MKRLSIEKKKKIEGFVLVLPFIIGLFAFFLYPLFMSVKLSFGKVTSVSGFQVAWSGFSNYLEVFTDDVTFVPTFLAVMRDTAVKIPLTVVFSLILAILINQKIRGRGLFRVLFFLPFLLGTGVVFEQLLNMGATTQLLTLETLGITPEMIAYLGPTVSDGINGFLSIIVMVLWNGGVQTLLFLSGLQGIPTALYESANVDGASQWEVFWKITLPMIAPIMLVNIIFSITDSFTNITNPIIEYIQDVAFSDLRFERAAAIGCLYLGFVLLLVGAVFLLMRRTGGMREENRA